MCAILTRICTIPSTNPLCLRCVHLHRAIDEQMLMRMCITLLLMYHLVFTCSVLWCHICRFYSCYARTVNALHGVEVATHSSRPPGSRRYTLYRIRVHAMLFKLKSHGLESRQFFDTKIGRRGFFSSFCSLWSFN